MLHVKLVNNYGEMELSHRDMTCLSMSIINSCIGSVLEPAQVTRENCVIHMEQVPGG